MRRSTTTPPRRTGTKHRQGTNLPRLATKVGEKCGLTVLLAGCLTYGSSAPPSAPAELRFETVAKGSHSGITEERFIVARDSAEFDVLWREHGVIMEPPPPRPEVDFSREMLVGIFAGTRPTAGHAVTIDRIRAAGTGAIVSYRHEAPDRSGMMLTVLTQPHHLVRVERVEGEVKLGE